MINSPEKRQAKISSSNAGGTASAGSKTYKISLPSSWVKSLDTLDVVMTFNGTSISISPRYNEELFKDTHLSAGHSLLEIRYFDNKKLCSLIYADETSHEVYVRNYVDDPVKRAFGVCETPSWDDLLEFIESRCIPRERAGIQKYLDSLGLSSYEPWDIVRKTEGRMAEDKQWLEINRL